MNIVLFLGAFVGFSSVLMAAFVDHSLALHLAGKSLNSILTAVKYHQQYGIIITMLGLALTAPINTRLKTKFKLSATLFLLGVLLFCGSIYIATLFHIPAILYLTPMGGILLMIAWVSLAYASFFSH